MILDKIKRWFKNWKLKRRLSKSSPNKKIVITDNKDGSQTISITQMHVDYMKKDILINNFRNNLRFGE